jgi:acyl-CoA thioesterase I
MSFMRRFFFLAILLLPVTAAFAAPKILVFGDSLSAGYGLDADRVWVALLQQRLEREAYPHVVVNASVSGETTSGGLARLPAALAQHRPQIVLIELGGNDGLRGLPPKSMRSNLSRMIDLALEAGARAVLFEMRIPPNYGQAYSGAFRKSFQDAAADAKVPLVPFFLGPIVDKPGMFQDDGLHPAAGAQALLLDAVWPTLEPLLKRK